MSQRDLEELYRPPFARKMMCLLKWEEKEVLVFISSKMQYKYEKKIISLTS